MTAYFLHASSRLLRALAVCALTPMCLAGVPGPDFRRDIRPILATHCYDCHGDQKPKGGLRLTSRAHALAGGDSESPAFVPGKSAESDLWLRVTSEDKDEAMPPKGERLNASEVALLKAWIDAGAPWPDHVKHWAYEPPVRAPLPHVSNASWPRQDLDRFILTRLDAEGLAPSAEAGSATLLRRVSLDLIGLPPSLSELQDFLGDNRADAFERAVDRLLASPHFGERWARPWLDLARYADSHGFQRDDLRDLWPYRDWVVRALNADMPFDQFTIAQLAGDLLPHATEDQIVATGFNRGTPCNVEAGTEPEENRVNQVFDRVNTIGAVWLGTTLECAQCHDHKYDPISMREYYQMFAFFNQTEMEADRANPAVPGSIRFIGPYLNLQDGENGPKREALEQRKKELQALIAAREKALKAELSAWADARKHDVAKSKAHVLAPVEFESRAGSAHRVLEDHSILLSDDNVPDTDTYTVKVLTQIEGITGFKLEALTDPSLPGDGPGRGDAARPNFVLNDFRVTISPATGKAAEESPVVFQKATASFSQKNFPVTDLLNAQPVSRQRGWAINPQFHQSHWAIFECATPVGFSAGSVLKFRLVQNFGSGRTIGRLRLTALTGKIAGDSIPAEIGTILAAEPQKWTAVQRKKLGEFQATHDPEMKKLRGDLQQVGVKLVALKPTQTLVMQENAEPRMSTLFLRGVYTDRGAPVEPGTPAILHAPKATPWTRLDLARWLVSRENPLTARVVVNRWWAELFGRGIVATAEDFGIKGEAPTHPELLDLLAVSFMENGWSMKKLLREIVTSAAYRQSSRVTPELLARDDQNKWLARGPRFRLDAETIRDNALAIAGLLNLKLGGPPIRPPQPDGLWEKVGGQKYDYVVSPGAEKHRRGLYVVLKRGAPYPSFVNFDLTSRMACTVKRSRSNTPLQALTLLNDPVYVEAAKAFAQRLANDLPQASMPDRIRYGFRLALTREPSDAETKVLETLFEAQRDAKDERTAWEAVAAALLNLDETITKG